MIPANYRRFVYKVTDNNLHNEVRWVDVTEENAGQRLDNFLITTLKGVPKSKIYKIIRKGEVRINKGRVKQTTRLAIGDKVRIPPIRVAEAGETVNPGQKLLAVIESAILFEDDYIMLINKPTGLAVHGGSGISLGLIETLRVARPEQRFLELVHRLDRDTSGVIMVAKKRSALLAMHKALQNNQMNKEYLALVHGRWRDSCKQVDAPLRKNELRSGERVVRVSDEGKASLTQYRVNSAFVDYTLVRAKPITGRTHQIRVHCQYENHPIAGDNKYCEDGQLKADKRRGITRLCLHAHRLTFKHPESGEKMSVEAPLDGVFEQVVNKFKGKI